MLASTMSSSTSSLVSTKSNGSKSAGGPNAAANSQRRTHAVNRSSELLACARTALQILQHESTSTSAQNNVNVNVNVNTNVNISLKLKSTDLQLYNGGGGMNMNHDHQEEYQSNLDSLQNDALQVLSHSDSSLQSLSTLVRRRGHTNDPTLEMQNNIQRFQTFMKELHALSTAIATHGSGSRGRAGKNKQRQRHYELVSLWLQNCGKERMVRFQEAMDMRGEVLKAQVRRRKLLEGRNNQTSQSSQSNGSNANTNVNVSNVTKNISKPKASQFNSPLFTMTTNPPSSIPPPKPKPSTIPTTSTSTSKAPLTLNGNSNGYPAHAHPPNMVPPPSKNPPPPPSFPSSTSRTTTTTTTTATTAQSSVPAYGSYYGNSTYNGSYGGGYGGVANHQDGMRRRNNTSSFQSQQQQPQMNYNNNNSQYQEQQQQQDQQQHVQAQQYEQRSQTRQRLEEARKAERSIAELTQIFGKMASLVSTQEEVLDNIEYDVENSLMETEGASKEIGKLYEMKQGNRGLILKTFGILIFMIIFMRFY